MEVLELKHALPEIKIYWINLLAELQWPKKRVSEYEDKSRETTQLEHQRGKNIEKQIKL